MARKRKEAEAEDAPTRYLLTYVGDTDVAGIRGYVMPRGVAVEVSAEVFERFRDHPMFEAS